MDQKGNGNLVVNIELAHIYTNQSLGTDQIIGVKIGRTVIEYLKTRDVEITTNVWIDDYNSPCEDNQEFAKGFLSELYQTTGFMPDYYAFESETIEECKKLLDTISPINKKWKSKGTGKKKLYIKSTNGKVGVISKYGNEEKYICPALSATYALAKCGAVDIPFYSPVLNPFGQFHGDISVTVLPNHQFFLESEQKAKDILSTSGKFSPYLDSIYHIWFDPQEPLKNCMENLVWGTILEGGN